VGLDGSKVHISFKALKPSLHVPGSGVARTGATVVTEAAEEMIGSITKNSIE
jgi:hypothetical protein